MTLLLQNYGNYRNHYHRFQNNEGTLRSDRHYTTELSIETILATFNFNFNERLRCYGVSAYVWTPKFFTALVEPFGEYMKAMDVACIMMKSTCHEIIKESLKVRVGGDMFDIRVVED